MMKLIVLVAMALVASANADCYLHNPAGSNNRINGKGANRGENDRLFDSQNNNRGGYNACDKGDQAANDNQNNLYFKSANREESNPQQIYDESSEANQSIQYPMMFYAGSELHMEWAVQHGCGGNEETDPNKLNCNMVIQYACDQDVKVKGTQTRDEALTVFLANGLNNGTPGSVDNCADDGNRITAATINNKIDDNDGNSRGRHESEGSYCECQMRKRDTTLYNADQALAGDSAQYTRQNNGGGRRGLECPEERDHYPYHSPTIWRDAAYLTDDVSRCAKIDETSMNTMEKGKCQEAGGGDGLLPAVVNAISLADCDAAGGQWNTYTYGITRPECAQAPYTRVNHLGNARGDIQNGEGVSPETASYNMTVPTWSTLTTGAIPVKLYPAGAENYAKCVARIRYNVSTDDYNPWNISDESNDDNNVIQQDPAVDVEGIEIQLQLALNTNQYGRTFQDRTHVFFIKKPTASMNADNTRVLNLNVRGKRGSTVQTYPSVEYDFTPTSADVAPGDMVHIQWCGSNTHENGDDAGDGEKGQTGEGDSGTDRHNLVMIKSFDDQFPVPYDKLASLGVPNLFDGECQGADSGNALSAKDCAVRAATAGHYKQASELSTKEMDVNMNDAPASFMGAGVLIKIPESCQVGTKYRYINTRNNKLGVSGQKGDISCVQGSA